MNLNLPLQQYSAHAAHVKEIIAPLQSYGIIGLFYSRIYTDGSIVNLASNQNLTDFYFRKLFSGHYMDQDIEDELYVPEGVSLWALNLNNQIWQDMQNNFGYGNGATLCAEHENFREIIGFYSTVDNRSINHFYINQVDMLKKMRLHFLSQSAELIQQAERDRLLFQHPALPQRLEFPCRDHNNKSNIINNSISSICIFHKKTGMPMQLSPQRSQCLKYLMQGKSTKEIAQTMRLASKTVEHYLEFIRRELGCRSSKELILSYANQVN